MELRDLVVFFVIGLLQSYLMCPSCPMENLSRIAVFSFVMWTLLWKGNTLLSDLISRKISWTLHPEKRFLIGIGVMIGYTVLTVLLLLAVFRLFALGTFGERSLSVVYGAVIVTIIISGFLHGRRFFIFWRKADIEREKFERESIAARYEALKNQVSPHFLFNSLNALTNLVYEDPDKAARFIKQLSEVYRYVLETREKEVVLLADELKFLESYLHLQTIRFGKKLNVTLGVLPAQTLIPPLALQMLVENAIKHNVMSDENPLSINVFYEDGFIVVENTLRRKAGMENGTRSGLGLANISSRYDFLTTEKVVVVTNATTFAVKLPVLRKIIA